MTLHDLIEFCVHFKVVGINNAVNDNKLLNINISPVAFLFLLYLLCRPFLPLHNCCHRDDIFFTSMVTLIIQTKTDTV